MATYSFPGTFEPHRSHPGLVRAEARIEPSVLDALAARGHDVQPWPEQTHLAGVICAIVPDGEGGLHAATDHRRPTSAVAW